MSPQPDTIQTEVIMDGRILEDNLKRMGLDAQWLQKQLKNQGHPKTPKIFLALCDDNKKLTVFAME